MSDTSDEANRIQINIFRSKSEEERFRIGDELTSFGRKIVESSILQDNPSISETELKIEVFKRCYSSEFSPEKMNQILSGMRAFFEK